MKLICVNLKSKIVSMIKFKIPFLRKKHKIKNLEISKNSSDQFVEIGKLVKHARIQKNISIQ